MASRKPEPVCKSGPKWLKEVAGDASQEKYWAKIGLTGPSKTVFAPLTGQDSRAYSVFLHALSLYCYTDDGERALLCMKHAVLSMQEHTRWIARASIPHVLDWGDQQTLWPKILAAVEQEADHA